MDFDEKLPTSICKYKTSLASSAWWQDAGQQYVNNFVPLSRKQYAVHIFDDIFASILKLLKKSTNLSKKSKEHAIKKLKAMSVHIGWASDPCDLGIELNADNKPSNIRGFDVNYVKGFAYQHENTIFNYNNPYNIDQWRGMGYHTVNAWYIKEYNSVYIPAAMLVEPFLSIKNPYECYPGVGRVMAHELVHAIDSEGRHVDENGMLRDWWSKSDKRKYKQNINKAITLYNLLHVNGENTLSENIADLIALEVSWNALLIRYRKENRVEPPDGMKREFFTQLAKIRFTKMTPKFSTFSKKYDVHASAEARVNGPLMCFTPFLELFNIEKENAMFYQIEKRPTFI